MGYHSTIYGCIFGVAYGPDWQERDEIMAANRRVIRGLPVDDEYPELTRNMFHVTGFLYGHPGLMKVQPMPFGLALKNFFDDWDVWLQKFETLLAKLAFAYAELHLDAESEAGQHAGHYRWRSYYPNPGWRFEGGERVLGAARGREEEALPQKEAELRERPADPAVLGWLFGTYARLGQKEKAREVFARLHAVDAQAAARLVERPYWLADCLPDGMTFKTHVRKRV